MALLRHTRLFRGALRGTSHALATPQFATWASTSRGAVRGLSTGSGQLSDSELQNIRKIAEDIEKNVQQGMEEMKEVYGADHADKVWARYVLRMYYGCVAQGHAATARALELSWPRPWQNTSQALTVN